MTLRLEGCEKARVALVTRITLRTMATVNVRGLQATPGPSELGLAVQVGGQVAQPGVTEDRDDRGVWAEASGDP